MQERSEKQKNPYSAAGAAGAYLPWFHMVDPVPQIEQPASARTWQGIRKIADANSDAYQKVFTNVPRDAFPRYDSVFHGFPAAGLSDKGHVKRMLYAQPPDLQPDFMQEPSIENDYVTSAVGLLGHHAAALGEQHGRSGCRDAERDHCSPACSGG
ncbi:hypothetical protein G6F68_016418 [Rhizopus microsporus]|nr:hypothetical protein G6F68_016418 [Rhizopus microsporus]